MKQTWLLIITIVGTLLMAGAVVLLLSKSGTPQSITVDQNLILVGANHVMGSADTPVTIVEFSDFQCPACRAAQPTVKNILNKYGDQIRFIYRHFPLTELHPYAYPAAVAAESAWLASASDSAKFWAYHDVLFDKQTEWTSLNNNDAVRDKLIQYATDLGIDKTKFSERMKDVEVMNLVNDDMKVGNRVGVTFTPSFFVNGVLYPAGELTKAVDQAVNNKIK